VKIRTILLLLLLPLLAVAEPVKVRYPEGSVHGFLVLRSTDGKELAGGDLTQVLHGGRVTSHLIFRFTDGSIDDETTVFTERGTFHLISDHQIQKGPMFPKPLEMFVDARSGKVTVHYQEDGHEKTDVTHIKLPADLANGVIYVMLKNILPATDPTLLSYVAATPKPRLVKLKITRSEEDKFLAGGLTYKATRLDIKVELGGLTGLIAPLLGKQPDDMYVWIVGGGVPALVKLQGQRYVGGPVWIIENAAAVGPESKR
jgi:hypothetical protein